MLSPYETRLTEAAADVSQFSRLAGRAVDVDGPAVAAMRGLEPRGQVSAGGRCRLLPAADRWVAVSLPRASDLELLPAWIERHFDADAWPAVAERLRTWTAAEAVERAALLGLAVAAEGEAAGRPERCALRGAPWAGRVERPQVVDLSSLWAGPLCGALLACAGASVVKVEALNRPDGARADPAFFHALNGAKEQCTVDGLGAALPSLLATADVVIEASRPRALAQLRIDVDALLAARPELIWVSITGHGRASERVGFGDDAAVAGGLVHRDRPDGPPSFVGDAIADPAAGLCAAAAALEAWARGWGGMIEVALSRVAAWLAS